MFGLLLFTARDLWCDPVFIVPLYLARLVFAVLLVGVLLVLRPSSSTGWVVWLGALTAASICSEVAVVGVIREDAISPQLNSIFVAMGSGALMPSGLWPQVAVVLSAELSILWNAYQLTGGFGPAVGHTGLATLVAFLCSVYVAYELQRNRRAIEEGSIELRESEERYRELFENASDMVYTRDLAGTFTSMNTTGKRLTGYGDQELEAPNIAQLVGWGARSLPRARSGVAARFTLRRPWGCRGGRPAGADWRHRRRCGHCRCWWSMTTPRTGVFSTRY